MTDNLSDTDKAVLDLIPPGQYVPFNIIEKRAPRGLDGKALYGALTGLVTRGLLVVTYGRGYLRPSPYDTGEILEPTVWATNGRVERFGRVDFENDESHTEVTVWVGRGPDGPIVHVIDHTDAATVDFDNDESGTEVTVWVGRGPDGPIVHSDAATVAHEE
jgi:hypothetical protein